jgi:DNA-binding Xre family transcriptional regulator
MQGMMTMPIRARIKVLLAEVNLERTRAGERPVSVRQLSEETGITHSALVQLVNGKSKMVAFETLDKLMQFFNIESLDRLLEYIPLAERTSEEAEGENK